MEGPLGRLVLVDRKQIEPYDDLVVSLFVAPVFQCAQHIQEFVAVRVGDEDRGYLAVRRMSRLAQQGTVRRLSMLRLGLDDRVANFRRRQTLQRLPAATILGEEFAQQNERAMP